MKALLVGLLLISLFTTGCSKSRESIVAEALKVAQLSSLPAGAVIESAVKDRENFNIAFHAPVEAVESWVRPMRLTEENGDSKTYRISTDHFAEVHVSQGGKVLLYAAYDR